MRAALTVLLLLIVALAGCAEPAPPASASEPSSVRPAFAGFRCPAGEAVVGFDTDALPVCDPFLPAAQKEATREVASNLKVVNVYGDRGEAMGDLRELRVMVELSAGAHPLDLSALVVRVSDGSSAGSLVWARSHDEAGRTFDVVCIRGDCGAHDPVMQSGDLVEIAFAAPQPVAPRVNVQVSLIPETGSAVAADFKTPSTYGTDRIITLR